MKYIRVDWEQTDPRFPITIYSELDDDRWEVRKVEVFSDGALGHADKTTDPWPCLPGKNGEPPSGQSHVMTFLGEKPLPPDHEIDAGAEFTVTEITSEQFEALWQNAISFVKKD